MPIHIDDRDVYPIGEALAEVGVSRSTYFRWINSGRIADTQFKDRNGRRVFTPEELQHLKRVAQQLQYANPQRKLSFEGGTK
jgi:DNA-binding transcriptional MerR regulator